VQFNILNPKKAVQSAVDRPDFRLAFVVVLLPALLAGIGTLLLGFSVSPASLLWSLVRSVLNWLALGIIVYVLLYLLKGRIISGKFQSIGSALSLIWIVLTLFLVIGFALLPLFVSAPVLDQAKRLQNGEIDQAIFTERINLIVEENPDALSENVGLALLIAGLLLVAWMVYLLYLLVADLFAAGAFKNAIATLLVIFVWYLVFRFAFLL